MNYSYVKPKAGSYQFIPDSGHEFNDIVYNTSFLDASSDEFVQSIGLYRTVLLDVPPHAKEVDGTMYFNKVGNVVQYRPNYILYTQEEQFAQVNQYFTDMTTDYIESKVKAYNAANGLAFKDIDAFTKYAVTPTSIHNAIAIQFIAYADKIWSAARTYQATATTVPTEVEFKAVLDGVVF